MQEYRSGHNEAVLKTVGLTARGFESLFLRQSNGHQNGVPFALARKRVRTPFQSFALNGVRTRESRRWELAHISRAKCIAKGNVSRFDKTIRLSSLVLRQIKKVVLLVSATFLYKLVINFKFPLAKRTVGRNSSFFNH